MLTSGLVTDEQLAEMGFPVRLTTKVVGSTTIIREGMTRSKAIMAAWRAGKLEIRSHPAHKMGGETWVENLALWEAQVKQSEKG